MSDPSNPHPNPAPSFQVRVPVEWDEAEDTPIVYANQVLVSHGGPEFFVVFGVVLPPTQPDQLPDSYHIRPQVRVVISREAMPAIVRALSENVARFQAATAHQPTPPS